MLQKTARGINYFLLESIYLKTITSTTIFLWLLIIAISSCKHNESHLIDNTLIKYTAGDVVTKGYLDSNGLLWFTTTNEGIFRFDGTSFKNYTIRDGLCGNEVWDIIEDSENNLWLGTANGLCQFNRKTFKTIPLPKSNDTSWWTKKYYPTINPQGVSCILESKSADLWLGTSGGGAYKFDGNDFTSFLKDKGQLQPDSLHHNHISSIIEDQEGNIWFSSFSHGGVSKWDGNKMNHFGLDSGLNDDMISGSYVDQSGRLWFSTRNGGMSYFEKDTFNTILSNNYCNNNMATLLEDSKGNFWMASYAREGVCTFDGHSFTEFAVDNSNKLNDIKCIIEDRNGHIWFGGRYGILWKYNGTKLIDYTFSKRS